MGEQVTVFAAYPFRVGQKIRIEGSRREGDWEVIGVDEHTVTLRCPISKREFAWPIFCYHIADEADAEWPKP